MKKLLIALILLILADIGYCQYKPFFFLDARSKSLGGAAANLTHAAYGFLWNPANLAATRQSVFSLNVNRTFSYNNAATASFFPNIGAVGVVLGRWSDSLATDYAGVGWATSNRSGFSVGLSGLILERSDKISPEISLGVAYTPHRQDGRRLIEALPIYRNRIRMAATLQNILLGSRKFGLPPQFTLGMSYETVPEKLKTFYELQFNKDRSDFIMGLEVRLPSVLLRSGIVGFDDQKWLSGAGFQSGPLTLDVVYDRFEKKIQFSTNIKFGQPPEVRGESHYGAGMSALRRRDLQSALIHFHNARSYVPENPKYQRSYLLVEQRDRELRVNEQRLLNRALTIEGRGQKLKALLIYHDLLRQFPGNLLAQRKVQQLRSSAYRELLLVRPNVVKLYENRDLINAKKLLDRLYAVFPSDTVIYRYKRLTERELRDLAEDRFLRGLGYYSQNDLSAAETEFESVKRYDPGYPEIDRYITEVGDRIRTRSARIDSLLFRAKSNKSAQRLTDAMENYDEVLRLDRNNVAARDGADSLRPRLNEHIADLVQRAGNAIKAEDYVMAENLSRQILRLEPNSASASTILNQGQAGRRSLAARFAVQGDSALVRDDPAQALSFYKRASQLAPRNTRYRAAISRTESRIQRDRQWQQAQSAFQTDDLVLAERLAIQLLSTEPNRQEIAQFLSLVVNTRDRKVTRLLQQGVKLYSQELYAQAIAAFDELLKIQPENKTANDYRQRTLDKIEALRRLRQ